MAKNKDQLDIMFERLKVVMGYSEGTFGVCVIRHVPIAQSVDATHQALADYPFLEVVDWEHREGSHLYPLMRIRPEHMNPENGQ